MANYKYDPLRRFLVRRRPPQDVRMTPAEIERIIGAILPKAAARADWWSNDPPSERGYVQCRAWLDAGYVAEVATPAAGIVFRPRCDASVGVASAR